MIAQSRYWMFTINNPANNELPGAWNGMTWCVWQRERGEQGTDHLQGYVIFEKAKRITGLKKLNAQAHWEPRRGNHEQARDYCSKEESRVDGPWCCGDEPQDNNQGKRNDLALLKRKLDSGESEAQIAKADDTFGVWARYSKVVARYQTLTGQQRNWPVYTHVIWGGAGLGKTRKVLELAGPTAYWLPRPAGQTAWFDGYIGQDTLVIDEFYGWLSLDLLCRVLDRYPFQVETKGGSVPLRISKCFITSNVPPAQWYPKMPPVRMRALWRRLEMPLGFVEQMLVPYDPDAQNQALINGLMAYEAPLSPMSLGGDGVVPTQYNREEWPSNRAVCLQWDDFVNVESNVNENSF